MSIELDSLASPADADNFRMTVDWGRWYIDPLPGCDIAPATEDRWPSCTKVKKASEKDWSFLVLPRVAAIDGAELARIGTLDQTQRLDALKSHEKHAQQITFGRGSIYHLWCEDLLAGRPPREITDAWLTANKYPPAALTEAKRYLPALLDFFQTYQPEPVNTEYVTIHRTLNGHGYGATVDALVKIEGEIVAVDWKTRGDSTSHAAYAEELAQVACGARAEYMVVRQGGEAVRQRIPDIKGGYIVSIKTDGARLYPLDIDKGWQHWCRLHEWWVARLTEKDGVGRVLPKKSAAKIAPEASPAPAEPTPPVLDKTELAPTKGAVVARYNDMSPADQETFRTKRVELGIDNDDTAGLWQLLDDIDHWKYVETTPPEKPETAPAPGSRPPAPEEGGEVTEIDVKPLGDLYEAMSDEAGDWFADLIAEGRNGHSWEMRAGFNRTVRRYEIYRGLIHLANWKGYDADTVNETALQPLVWAASGEDDAVLFDNVTPGVALGTLNVDQAKTFSSLVDDLVANRAKTVVDQQGRWRLQAAA